MKSDICASVESNLWNVANSTIVVQEIQEGFRSSGFKFNPYDPCLANWKVKGSQHTILFHVDDLKCSCKKKTVNDDFAKWLEKTYCQHRKVKVHHGKVHEYLGMKLDYSEKKKLKIDTREYVKGMLDAFPLKFKKGETAATPAGEDLFGQKSSNDKKLKKDKAEAFQTTTAQGLFLTKRARPDIHTGTAFLCIWVQDPNEEDWEKTIQLMKYLNGKKDFVLTLSADQLNILKWYVSICCSC